MIKKIHFNLISSVLIVLVLNGCSFILNEKFDTEVIHTRDVFKKLVDFRMDTIKNLKEDSQGMLTWNPVVYATGYDIECYTSTNSFVKVFQVTTEKVSLRDLEEGISYITIVPCLTYKDHKFTGNKKSHSFRTLYY